MPKYVFVRIKTDVDLQRLQNALKLIDEFGGATSVTLTSGQIIQFKRDSEELTYEERMRRLRS